MNKELKHKIDLLKNTNGRKTGFSIPKNYFDTIEEDFYSKIVTDKFPSKNSFNTPKNYFNNVEDVIIKKLYTKEPKVIPLHKRLSKFIPYAAAASVLLFIGLNYFNTHTNSTLENLTKEDISSWYEDGFGNTNNEDFIAVLNPEDLNEDFLTIDDNSVEDYLNTVDNPLLFNELD